MHQEPWGPQKIWDFISSHFGVNFPMLAKGDVNGDTKTPLYNILESNSNMVAKGDATVPWNYAKFLVSKHGTTT